MSKYSMTIEWSEEDRLFLVTIPEFSDLVEMPCTQGKNRTEAIQSGKEVIKMYLEMASYKVVWKRFAKKGVFLLTNFIINKIDFYH